ncbi:hypothetical protein ABZ990_09915 [Streptomyces sp. NPDC046203]|uniref:hypothetical protein n=1 Tax=Streptomyces sp. NPDC046203 TaxID=3154602 RepID=UPI0033FA7682
MRLRIRRTDWPRPAVILADTPRPDCPDCQGYGGHTRRFGDPYGDGFSEYGGPVWESCPCWDENRRWTVLPLPRCRMSGYSDEPPF